MRRLAITFTLAAVSSAAAQDSRPVTDERGTTIEFRSSALLDLHHLVRDHLSGDREPPEVAGFDTAILAARTLDQEFGGAFGWGVLDGALAGCENVDEFLLLAKVLPEVFKSRTGKSIALRRGAIELATAYQRLEAWHADLWPQRRHRLERTATLLRAILVEAGDAWLGDTLSHLNMADPLMEIPVYLITEAPFPGAFTHRSRETTAVCIVALDSLDHCEALQGGPPAIPDHDRLVMLCESALHESLHALDVATARQPTVFNQLRTKLEQAGIDRRDPLWRDVPHTLMFVHAGEMVRRHISPSHQHYGHRCGYYAKAPKAVAAVRERWVACLDGRISPEQFIEQTVSAVAD